jgi:4-hydroxy-tetrahydrodipicolinate reductase
MTIINIGIAGCLGRMGKELVKEVINDNRLSFSGGFEHPQHNNVNRNISDLIDVKTENKVSDNAEKIFSRSDVLIDFTTPESTFKNVLIAAKQHTAIVIGTTGLDEKVLKEIKKCSKNVAVLQSANMSVCVNLFFKLVHQAASTLRDNEYDIEIAETHHKHKIDAPSGTAIALGKFAAKGRNSDFNETKIYDRTKSSIKRETGNIGFAVTRGGEIAGEHTVSFIGTNDRFDLTHKAQNRVIFVKGAIEAAIFLSKKKAGLYSMEDVIKI